MRAAAVARERALLRDARDETGRRDWALRCAEMVAQRCAHFLLKVRMPAAIETEPVGWMRSLSPETQS